MSFNDDNEFVVDDDDALIERAEGEMREAEEEEETEAEEEETEAEEEEELEEGDEEEGIQFEEEEEEGEETGVEEEEEVEEDEEEEEEEEEMTEMKGKRREESGATPSSGSGGASSTTSACQSPKHYPDAVTVSASAVGTPQNDDVAVAVGVASAVPVASYESQPSLLASSKAVALTGSESLVPAAPAVSQEVGRLRHSPRFRDFPGKLAGGREKRCRSFSASEEANLARAVLAKFELSLPTMRFDAQLKQILSPFAGGGV
ncbi:hypothetical protein DQ04_00641040 [Trypanosoma grayi]|uniref:hypothetical protein n=1 Tax=Trypanosoma grayi TaxID=71804 RepID=UPI0004F42D6E|nr:hypothetical protein DQ04_00641040 [Trypanosoma grayi]KEG14060.1 hypothetical protein DQ04_00641040 [Trypanosoma grayi]